MGKLILLRHGESKWNLENRFTGWVDVPLSEKGVKEALSAGKKLAKIPIDIAFTSTQIRAHQTLFLSLLPQKRVGAIVHDKGKEKTWSHHKKIEEEIPVYTSWRLNERYYGKLQGLNKDWARKKWGEEKVHMWRRSYDIPPPGGESLKDTYKRSVPYFLKEILPLSKKKNVIVSAHGNSLRAIIKHVENINDQDIPQLEIPTGKPIVYEWKKGKLAKIK